MLDLDISLLQLNIENAQGHEHRVQPIAVRATEILTARLDQAYKDKDIPGGDATAKGVTAPAINMDLRRTGDEQAAQIIAAAWLDAITLQLEA